MKLKVPANLLLAAIHAAGHAHTMGDDGANISFALEDKSDSLFESDATYAVAASKEKQTLTVTTLGASTFANASVAAVVEEDGTFCFNPTKMGLPTLLRTLGQHLIQVAVINENLLNIYCGAVASAANFSGLGKPIALAPQSMGKTVCELSSPTDVVLSNLQSVFLSVMPPNGESKVLKGVHLFESSSGTIQMVTTDMVRVTRVSLEVTHQEGKLADGITLSTKVLAAYRSAVGKLIDKENLASSKTTLTVGENGMFFLCAETESVKLCLQCVGNSGKFPPQTKGALTQGEPDLKIGGCSAKALIESFKPLAAWAKAADTNMCALYAEKSQLRVGFRSNGGYLMHFAVPATSNVQQPACFCANVEHFMELLNAIKDVGDSPLTINVWLPAGKSPRIAVRLPKTNPDYLHMMSGMTPPPAVDVYSWFDVPAPLYERPEETPKATGKKKSSDNAVPNAATTAKGAKGKTATTPPAAAAPKGTVARKKGTTAKSAAKPPAAANKTPEAKPPTTIAKGGSKPAAKANTTPTIPGIEGGNAAK